MKSTRRSRILSVCAVLLAAVGGSMVAAEPALAVPSLVTVSGTSVTDSQDFKGVGVTCPSGTKLLGGGGNVVGGGHSVRLYYLNPIPPNMPANSMFAAATEDRGGYPYSWYVIVYAICGTGVSGYQVVKTEYGSPVGATHGSAVAYCPAGKKVVGGGGVVFKNPFVLNEILIHSNLGSVHVDGYAAENLPAGISMGVWAYAICISPVPGLQFISANSGYSSDDKVVTAICPSGTKVHGAGAALSGAAGQAYIDALVPDSLGSAVTLVAQEDSTGYSGNWTAYVYATCAT